jgi:hypothetical protein
MWGHIIFHPRTCDRGGSGPCSHRGFGRGHSEDRGGLWDGCAQGWSSRVWALCGFGELWGPWVRGSACDSTGPQRGHHCDTAYPYPSHLGTGASFGSVVVEVGREGRQLQQGGLPFLGGGVSFWGVE